MLDHTSQPHILNRFPLEKGILMRFTNLPCRKTSAVVCARALYCGTMSTVLLSKDISSPFAGKENGTLSSPVKAKDNTTATKRTSSEAQSRFRVKKLTENATLPVRGSAGAAGYDLARLDCNSISNLTESPVLVQMCGISTEHRRFS